VIVSRHHPITFITLLYLQNNTHTHTVIFTDPYIQADKNRWTSPQLDADKQALQDDPVLLLAVASYKDKFITETQALLHADLHSGSVMCSPTTGTTFVIDPEFAFYGPMSFDTGLFVANLLLNYVSQQQPGGTTTEDDDDTYDEWILDQIKAFWLTFVSVFRGLWDDPVHHVGYRYERRLFPLDDDRVVAQEAWIANMLSETLGFAGCEMIRRIVGIAHVEDLERMEDDNRRAKCERHGLEVAKVLVKDSSRFPTIDAALDFVRSLKP
jgi:5-methylthioribose kinase